MESHNQTSRITRRVHLKFISTTSVYSLVRTKCHTMLVIVPVSRHLHSSTLPVAAFSPPPRTLFKPLRPRVARDGHLLSMSHFSTTTGRSCLPDFILYGPAQQASSFFSAYVVLWADREKEDEEFR